MESNAEQPHYRAKIIQTTLKDVQPTQALPDKIVELEQDEGKSVTSRLWLFVLLLGVLSFLLFSLFEAVVTIELYFKSSPLLSTLLGAVLGAFVLTLAILIYREVKGYRDVRHFMESKLDLRELQALNNRQVTLTKLQKHSLFRADSSYAHRRYRQFSASINSDLSNQEIIDLYTIKVLKPTSKKADEVLRKESFVSGGLAFISPNSLIQTVLIFWISMRTLKRIANVFGLRAGVAGNWTLIKIVAENMAAQSFFDLATDEITNQMGGSLAARFMENSAEAIAAGSLNARLGKALIRLLDETKMT